jgi:glucan phosphorylase
VERVVRIDRAYLIAAAAARDFNDELTVILNSLDAVLEHLEEGHPALPLLNDLQGAAQRCVWKTAGLLEFSVRRGIPPSIMRLERLLDL